MSFRMFSQGIFQPESVHLIQIISFRILRPRISTQCCTMELTDMGTSEGALCY